nr:histone deacetylase 14 [Tanacetum cinerariifolium]
KMADVYAPSGQAPDMAPPVRPLQLPPPYPQFTSSSFWDMIQYDKKDGCYRCQLDEQWFVLTKDTLREALQITPINSNHAFTSPPTADVLINFVNELGYPKFHPRPDSPLHLPNEEPVPGYLKFSAKGTKREVFGMPIPGSLITAEIHQALYYREYLAKVAQHRRYLIGETGGVQDPPAPKPTHPARKTKLTAPKAPPRLAVLTPVTSAQHAPTLEPAKPQEKKRKQATKTSDKPPKAKKSKYGLVSKKRTLKNVAASKAEGVHIMEPQVAAEDAELQKVLEESMKTAYALPKGPLPPVVIREPKSGKYQPLPKVPGKGKTKVTEEEVAHDLLSLQKHKKISLADQYIFQRRVSEPTGSSRLDESLYDLLGQSDSEEESEKVVLRTNEGGQDEGQAGPDPGQARPDPGDAGAKVQSIPSHVVHARSDREHIDLDVADISPQPFMEQLNEGDRPSDADKNAETEVESLVNVTIKQAMSSISLMTSPIIDLTLRLESPKEHKTHHGQSDPSEQRNEGEVGQPWVMSVHTGTTRHPSIGEHSYHMQLFEALEKSMNRDHTEELEQDLAEARKKNKKRRESPKMPLGSPSHQPPPPPPPAGQSGPLGAPGASGSSQAPPPPPPPPSSTNLEMDEDMAPDEQEQLSNDEDIGSAHIPTVNLRQGSLASNYSPPPEDSLLAQTDDIAIFMDWFCKGRECHKLLTDSVDNPILRHNVSKPLPLGGPPSQVTIQSGFFFNKDLKYLRYDSKGRRPALSISKIKAAYYTDDGLEQMVPDYAVRTHMRILSVVRIEIFSMYGYDYMKKIVLHRADLNEHVIMERDFNDGMLQQIDEALDYRVKEFRINRMTPGLNMRFWTRKDVDRCKAFMFAIQRHLRTRRIFRNLESFVGGRVREGDYRLLKRTE